MQIMTKAVSLDPLQRPLAHGLGLHALLLKNSVSYSGLRLNSERPDLEQL
jgi:hypothetical protein